MNFMMTAEELSQVIGGKIVKGKKDAVITGFTSDSRLVKKGSCFAALKGTRVDGRDFISEAVKGGASVVLSDAFPDGDCIFGATAVVTDNISASLASAAAYYRKKNMEKAVAITGSVGKTTVKELIYSVLSQRTDVLKTEENKNNLLGLSLTLLSENAAKNAVLELGISNIGEMEQLSKIASPDVAVITNIGKMHAEGFKSREITAEEKLNILTGMKPDGILIINGDEPLLTESDRLPANTVRVSEKSKNADYYIHGISSSSAGTVFCIDKKGKEHYRALFVPIVGKHGALLAGFAVAVGEIFGCDESEIRRGLLSYKPCGDRQRIEDINGISCIFDCYNAGPESFDAALEAFEIIFSEGNFSAKGIVVGDMLELGEISREEHLRLGERIKRLSPDLLVTVGKEAAFTAEGALHAGMEGEKIFAFEDNDGLISVADTVKRRMKKDSLLLIKGSRGMRLERLKELLAK